jgi:hypothetical protein
MQQQTLVALVVLEEQQLFLAFPHLMLVAVAAGRQVKHPGLAEEQEEEVEGQKMQALQELMELQTQAVVAVAAGTLIREI